METVKTESQEQKNQSEDHSPQQQPDEQRVHFLTKGKPTAACGLPRNVVGKGTKNPDDATCEMCQVMMKEPGVQSEADDPNSAALTEAEQTKINEVAKPLVEKLTNDLLSGDASKTLKVMPILLAGIADRISENDEKHLDVLKDIACGLNRIADVVESRTAGKLSSLN